MNELILTGTELLHYVDLGYKEQEDTEARFPIRLSAIGHCPRKLRALLGGVAKREFTPRSLRIFEQGHDRGARLFNAITAGLIPKLRNMADPEHGWQGRFDLLEEAEVWCPTNIRGEAADAVVAKAHEWQKKNEVDDPDKLSVMVGYDGVLFVRGAADLIIVDKLNKTFWVIDFKTKASWGFKKLDEEGNDSGYEDQVRAYVHGFIDENEGFECRGAYLFYEDHDKRYHKVLEVDLDPRFLDHTIDRISKLLFNWASGGPISEASADYAQRIYWKKSKHVKGNGMLPWQCNYCTVGPVTGECIDSDLYRLEDSRGKGEEFPRYEVYDK